METMKIIFNGKKEFIPNDFSVKQFVEFKKLHSLRIAVIINTEIIDNSNYDKTIIKSNDNIEILTAVGGG